MTQWHNNDSARETGTKRPPPQQTHDLTRSVWKSWVGRAVVECSFGRAAVLLMAAVEGGVREAVGCFPPSCQSPLSARRPGCVGRPGSSVADASPHVRGRQWPGGERRVLIPHWAISPSRWRAAAGAPLPDNYQALPQMEMSVSLTGPGSCHCLRPRPLYLSRPLPTLTMCSVTAD